MSELIDRIFDAEKISADINLILRELGKVEGALGSFSDKIKEVETTTRKAKGADELAKNAKTLNDTVTKGGVEMKRWEVEVAKLNEKTKQLTDTEKLASIEIAKARLELQAAQKATKDAAIAEIELTAANKNLAGSYNALNEDLKKSIKAYKELSGEEAKGAKGQALIKKISETQNALKASDASMGNYQRNVGNYASALQGLTPKLGGVGGVLLDMAESAKEGGQGFKTMGQDVAAAGKAMLTNPFVLIGMAIVLLIKNVSDAIGESEERTNKISEAFARFKPILRYIGDGFEFIADAVIGFIDVAGRAYDAAMKFLGIDTKGSDEFVRAEKLKQKAVADTRKLNEEAAKSEAIIAEQREIIADKENYSYSQRMAALRVAQKEEQKLSTARVKNAELNLKALQSEAALDDTNAEMNDKVSAAIVNVSNAKKENAALGRKLGKEAQKLSAENITDMKAEADAAKARDKIILDAKRRLVDSQFALLAESEDKAIKVSNEANKRKLEDLKANGELTKELQKNLTKAQENEILKIKNEWSVKGLNESIKADELTLQNMKSAGQNTLQLEKDILNQRMEAEILAGGSKLEIQQKYKFLELDLVAKTADEKASLFEKELTKQTEILSNGYKKQEIETKKAYANGEISKEQYEKALSEIQLNALQDVNQKTIDGLRLQLDNSELSTDKRAELSKKLRDLEIENENAVVDATIKSNDDKIKADQDAAAKRKEIIMALANAGAEIFGAIADYQNQQSENRIAGLEAEQEALDNTFAKDQENLDNAIMSDETRAEKQKELNEKKAADEKVIADKIKEEKIKQAKWDKANAIAQSIITAGLAILNASLTKPFLPLGLIAAGLAATMGAIQVATIASTPIPAYEKGGITGDGLALWGETRPEVAVTPQGNIMLAEEPTISNFDAGTRIYKSVEDYNTAMSAKGGDSFKFDYDKLANAIPSNEFEFDGNGLLIARDKRGNRRTMINRRYTL